MKTKERLQKRLEEKRQSLYKKAEDWGEKIESKWSELAKFNAEAAKLMAEAKKDFRKNPLIVTCAERCITAAREIIALMKQAEAEGFIHSNSKFIYEMCQNCIHNYSKVVDDKAQAAEAARELKKSNPEDSISMYVLGIDHFLKQEFKQASAYFEKSRKSNDKFFFFYSTAKYYQSLNPVNVDLVEENYKNAERYEDESTTTADIGMAYISMFYRDWAKFYVSIKKISDAGKLLKKRAELGDTECQAAYTIYLEKYDQDYSLSSIDWKKKAAQQGDIESQVSLALFFLQYIFVIPGMPKSEKEEAAKHYQTLLELSEQSLQAKMGVANCMSIGKGVEKNIPKAIEILQSVIEITKDEHKKISLEAKFCLGQLYCENGNVKAGIRLIRDAASEGHCGAQINLALFHEVGWGVEVNSLVTERLLKEAAQVSRFGYKYWQAFLKRRLQAGAITQETYQEKNKELSSESLPLHEEFISIFNPVSHGGEPSQFTTESYDNAKDGPFCSRLDTMIINIAQNPNLYVEERIRALFFRIALAKTLDNINLVKTFFNIGKLFAKISSASCDIISQYTAQISTLVDRLSAKAPVLKANEIALALDGISKLHLNPEQEVIQHNIILLLRYAQKNILDFNPKDLSMAVSGLIRLGLSWSVFLEYLKLFLENIQNRWQQFETVSLIHFAYMFAVLDVDQPDNQPRLISMRLLEQLFKNIKTRLASSAMDTHSASQLNLALRYFSKRYEKNQSAIPSLSEVGEDFKKQGAVKIPPGQISGLQFQVCRFIAKKGSGKKLKLEVEVEVNGLRVDAVVDQKLIIQVQGPSHYKYLLDKSVSDEKATPVQTSVDKFHDTLCKQAGYQVKHVPFFIWQNLRTDKDKMKYLRSEGIIPTPL